MKNSSCVLIYIIVIVCFLASNFWSIAVLCNDLPMWAKYLILK